MWPCLEVSCTVASSSAILQPPPRSGRVANAITGPCRQLQARVVSRGLLLTLHGWVQWARWSGLVRVVAVVFG